MQNNQRVMLSAVEIGKPTKIAPRLLPRWIRFGEDHRIRGAFGLKRLIGTTLWNILRQLANVSFRVSGKGARNKPITDNRID